MKRFMAVLGVVALIGFGAFAQVSAQGEKENRPGHSHGMRAMMGGIFTVDRPLVSLALQNKDQLGLTSEQVKALEVLRSEFQKEATRRSADLQIAEIELAELIRADSADLTKVEVKLRQVESLRTDLRFNRIKTLEKGKALLTPEQRKKLESLSLRASADPMMSERGMEEMQRFMQSERMPQAMSGMMEMARRMGNGDTMAGMVRITQRVSRFTWRSV